MGYNLVTWNPCIAADNTDKACDIPGSTTMAGTVDPGLPVSILEGDSSGFSDPPTLDQINASSGINQIIALINYRAAVLNKAFPGRITWKLPYLSGEPGYLASDFQNIYSKINVLLAAEGFAPYPAFPTIASGKASVFNPATMIIRGTHVAHMRKALRIAGTQNITLWGAWQHIRKVTRQHVRPSGYQWILNSETLTNAYSGGEWGESIGFYASTPSLIQRALADFYIPDWADGNHVSSANLRWQITGVPNPDDGTVVVELWSSDTDDHVPTASSAYNRDHLESTCTSFPSWAWIMQPVSGGTIGSRKGSFLSLILKGTLFDPDNYADLPIPDGQGGGIPHTEMLSSVGYYGSRVVNLVVDWGA